MFGRSSSPILIGPRARRPSEARRYFGRGTSTSITSCLVSDWVVCSTVGPAPQGLECKPTGSSLLPACRGWFRPSFFSFLPYDAALLTTCCPAQAYLDLLDSKYSYFKETNNSLTLLLYTELYFGLLFGRNLSVVCRTAPRYLTILFLIPLDARWLMKTLLMADCGRCPIL